MSWRHFYKHHSKTIRREEVTHLFCAVALVHGHRRTPTFDSGQYPPHTRPFVTTDDARAVIHPYFVLQVDIFQRNHLEICTTLSILPQEVSGIESTRRRSGRRHQCQIARGSTTNDINAAHLY
jgi:hypothetical protein